jgi:hypothetical protein
MLVGDGEAGKTSMSRAFTDPHRRAGRIGKEQRTVGIDLSVLPHTDLREEDGGPDFRHWPDRPFRSGPAGDIFSIPLSRGFYGRVDALVPALARLAMSDLASRAGKRIGGSSMRLTLDHISGVAHGGRPLPCFDAGPGVAQRLQAGCDGRHQRGTHKP